MLRQSSMGILWFIERMPNLYFYITMIIALIVMFSSLKLFYKMHKKTKVLNFKVITWQKWTIFGMVLGLLLLIIAEIIYKVNTFYGILPYYTTFVWKLNLFTSFIMLTTLGVWIFKGIITNQFISWKKDFIAFRITKFTINKVPILKKKFGYLYQDKKEVTKKREEGTLKVQTNFINSPTKGRVKLLDKVEDSVFSKKLMGDGIAIVPKIGKVYSPVSGIVETASVTSHVYGIKTKDNISILVHIGINTVKLKGKGFKQIAKQGQQIKLGDLLAEVDLKFLKDKKIISDIIVLVLPKSHVKIKLVKTTGLIGISKKIIKII